MTQYFVKTNRKFLWVLQSFWGPSLPDLNIWGLIGWIWSGTIGLFCWGELTLHPGFGSFAASSSFFKQDCCVYNSCIWIPWQLRPASRVPTAWWSHHHGEDVSNVTHSILHSGQKVQIGTNLTRVPSSICLLSPVKGLWQTTFLCFCTSFHLATLP